VLAAAVYETLLRFKSGPGLDPTAGLEVEGRLAEILRDRPGRAAGHLQAAPNVRFTTSRRSTGA
jgi:hypothetical protein